MGRIHSRAVDEAFPVDGPLMTCRLRDNGLLLVWNRYDAVAALGQEAALAEFALRSLRIGGARHLSVSGVPSEVLHKEGTVDGSRTRTRQNSYVGANDANCGLMSIFFTERGRSGDRQPDQGTKQLMKPRYTIHGGMYR